MKVAKNRVFVISLVLVIAGVSLIKVSYNFPDTYVNTNLNTYNASVSSNGEASIIFTQPYNLTENITFGINSQYTVHYRLYLYYHVDYRGTYVNQYSLIREGNATNDTLITLQPTSHLQGQQYALNMTAGTEKPFHVEVMASNSLVVTKETSRYLGSSGIGATLAGVVLLAVFVSGNLGAEAMGRNRA